MTNKINPSSIRALTYRASVASLNSLARVEAMLLPAESREAEIWCELPITKVDGHGLAEGPAQTQKYRADDAHQARRG